MQKRSFVFIVILAFLTLSCASKKDVLYFQDFKDQKQFTPPVYESIIKNNDRLSIVVSASNMAAVSKYNRITPSQADDQLNRINGQPLLLDYLVDNNGYIDLPEIGPWKVAGKSRFEVQEELKSELSKFIKDPSVTIRLTNFKITVLGEVERPGTFNVNDERLTLPQALGLAGDLTLFGKRKDVILLRDNNGVQESRIIDLTTVDVLSSDLYYLQQNDVIYVGQNAAQVNSSSFSRNNGLFVSIASVLISLTSVIILITR